MQPNKNYLNGHFSPIYNQENIENIESLVREIYLSTERQSHTPENSLSMRKPISSGVLLEKISDIDFSSLVSLTSMIESQTKFYEAINFHKINTYELNHPFSMDHWNDFDQKTNQEKKNKIGAFVSSCLIEFKEIMNDERKKIFAKKGDFTQYLLRMKDEHQFSLLMKECAQYYALLSKSKNNELKSRLIVQFPPQSEDLACIPGTRTRLQSVIRALKREYGLLNPLDDMIQHGVQQQFDKVFTDYKLYQHVHSGNEIHLQPYFHHILGVSEEIITKTDQFFLLPQAEITAESAFNFLSSLKKTISNTIKNSLKESISDFSQQLSYVEKEKFVSGLLNDIENGAFVSFMKSFNYVFTISGSSYKSFVIDEGGGETEEYQWDEQELYNFILNELKGIESKSAKKTDILFDYKDAFNPAIQDQIAFFLRSNNPEELEYSINLLFVLVNEHKGSSPIEFMNILIKSSEYHHFSDKDFGYRCLSFTSELKIKCHENEKLSHLSEKINFIHEKMSIFLKNNSGRIESLQLYLQALENKIDLSVPSNISSVAIVLIFFNASVNSFQSILGNRLNDYGFVIPNLSELIAYAPEKKELIQYFSQQIKESCLHYLVEKSISIKDHQVMSCFFDKKYLLNNLIETVKNRNANILNRIIDSVSKEEFFSLDDNNWFYFVCDFIALGEKSILEMLASKYFDSSVKEMLFKLKDTEMDKKENILSQSIQSACFSDSMSVLRFLNQAGCNIEDILFLSSSHEGSSFIQQLFNYNDDDNHRETYPGFVNQQRYHAIAWLINNDCPLSYFQDIINNDHALFMNLFVKRGGFDVLAKILKNSQSYDDFMIDLTSRHENALFLAACAASSNRSSLDFIQASLDHPGRSQTLNQPDDRGWTPLHQAASQGNVDLITILLKDNLLSLKDIESENEGFGQSPISIAEMTLYREANTEQQQKIERCIEMLEYKKKQLSEE